MPDSDVRTDQLKTDPPPAEEPRKVPLREKWKQKLPDLSIGQMTYLVLVASVPPAIVSAGISWGMLRAATQANEIAKNATSAARDASSAAKESAAAASASNKIASAALDVSKKSASAAESSAESASKAVLNAERADLLNLRGLVADETTAPGHRSRALIELAEIERKRYGGLLLSDHTFENVQIIDIDLSNARFTRVAIRKKQISNANLVDIEFNTTSIADPLEKTDIRNSLINKKNALLANEKGKFKCGNYSIEECPKGNYKIVDENKPCNRDEDVSAAPCKWKDFLTRASGEKYDRFKYGICPGHDHLETLTVCEQCPCLEKNAGAPQQTASPPPTPPQ